MIQLGIFLPLAVGGVIVGVWRKYLDNQVQRVALDLPALGTNKVQDNTENSPHVYDDVGELQHSQQVSLYSLALTASGTWFYAPIVTLASIPLLGYSAYHFITIMRHSDAEDRKKPFAIFEAISLGATLITGQLVMASLLFLFSFGVRKLLLQAGNISNNIPLSLSTNPNIKRVWVLRDGAEIEISVSELASDDIIVLHDGDMIVVKGKIIKGDGVVRQFSLRKKMKSVPKTTGDKVFPFTLLQSGSLHIQLIA